MKASEVTAAFGLEQLYLRTLQGIVGENAITRARAPECGSPITYNTAPPPMTSTCPLEKGPRPLELIMTKKKQSQSLFDFLVQKPWWVSMVGAIVLTMGIGALFPPDKRVFGLAAGIPFLIVGFIAAWRQWMAPSSATLARVREKALAMNWPEFAAYLSAALRSQGYEVKAYDGKGADFEISKPGKHLLLACKRWKAASLGVETLRELQAASEDKGLHAMCITMGRISPAAFEYAAQERIDLMDAEGLVLLLASAKSE